MNRVSLEVNGAHYETEVESRLLLADLLRDHLRLTGTHLGCEHGVCGSCTVQIDGKPARSCLTFAVQADGCSIRTVEGLARPEGGRLHPIQDAFHEHHALQCGYCTPGFLMSIEGLLPELTDATDEELRASLAGNLCRCTGYQNIVEATQAAASSLMSCGEVVERIVVERELGAADLVDRAWAGLADPKELLAAAGIRAIGRAPDGRSRGRVVADQIPIDGTLELVDLDDDRRVANFEIQARELEGPGQIRGVLQMSLHGSRLVVDLYVRFLGTTVTSDHQALRTMIELAAVAWSGSLAAQLPARPPETVDAQVHGAPLPALAAIVAAAGMLWLMRKGRWRRR
jgi:carbon-monoxide dehydrogenase small subunit